MQDVSFSEFLERVETEKTKKENVLTDEEAIELAESILKGKINA